MHTRLFYFIGIGGAGMSVVAELLAARGCHVLGSDRQESDNTVALRKRGISVAIGQRAQNVPADAIVVVSSAIRDTNPELAEARRKGLTVIHRSQALALAAAGMRMVAVAGAHGKTSTTSMIAVALAEIGWDPSVAVGGIIEQWHTGAIFGGGDVLVAEADESDGSFLNYQPAVEVVTNVEPDHLDHYGTAQAFEEAFKQFADCLVPGGTLICCAEDAGAARLARAARMAGHQVLTYGRAQVSDELPNVVISQVVTSPAGSQFHVAGPDWDTDVSIQLPGIHNVLNATAALSAGIVLGAPAADMARGVSQFLGAARRFDWRGQVGQRRVFDDYAHHPTEVEAALAQARLVAGEGEVTVVFQPHLFSRTRNFADRFAKALCEADHVVLTDIYPAREDPIPGVTSALIADQIPGAELIADMHEAARRGAELTGSNGIVITMGAGDITTTAQDVLEQWRGGTSQ